MSCIPSALTALTTVFQIGKLELYLFISGAIAKIHLRKPVTKAYTTMLLGKNDHLSKERVHLDFEARVDWDVDILASRWAYCMDHPPPPSETRKVGIIASFQLQSVLGRRLSGILCDFFRLTVFTSSMMYNYGLKESYCSYTLQEFYIVWPYSGVKVLEGLEPLVRPVELAKASAEYRRDNYSVNT